jgi:hypothetical protein
MQVKVLKKTKKPAAVIETLLLLLFSSEWFA